MAKSYGLVGSTTACQKCRYGYVTTRSSMREHSPFVSHTREGTIRSSATQIVWPSAVGMLVMGDFVAFGSRIYRVVGEVSLLGPLWILLGSEATSSGGNQKKTLPSATVRSIATLPSGSS